MPGLETRCPIFAQDIGVCVCICLAGEFNDSNKITVLVLTVQQVPRATSRGAVGCQALHRASEPSGLLPGGFEKLVANSGVVA